MTFDSSHKSVKFTDKLSLGILTKSAPRDLVDEVVNDAEKKEKRSRLLPARVVVYYVMAMGLFFGESYDEVMRRLVGGLRFLGGWSTDWQVPSASAISHARKRLGEEPLRRLFERVAVPIAQRGSPGAWFGRWRLMSVDGVILDAPDTIENESALGRSNTGRDEAAFPQPRVVALAECGTQAIVAASIGGWHDGERTLADNLLPWIEPGMLVLADRGFHSLRLWDALMERGAGALFRVSSQVVLPPLRVLEDGSYISVLLGARTQSPVRKGARRFAKGDSEQEKQFLLDHGAHCRVVEYHIEGSADVVRLITSLLDPEEISAIELARLYHERWEIELLFDELQVHQMGHGRVLRSKTPEMVRQEIWGILLTHYAIRRFIREAAQIADVDDDRISFLTALLIIRHDVTSRTELPPRAEGRTRRAASGELIGRLLPPRRHRFYPRVVKRHWAKFHKLKRSGHSGENRGRPPLISVNPP